LEYISQLKAWFQDYPISGEALLGLIILAVSITAYFIFRKVVTAVIQRISEKTKTKFDDYLIESNTLKRFSLIIPVLIINIFSFTLPYSGEAVSRIMNVLIIWILVWTAVSFMMAVNRFYETFEISKERPIKGYIQVVNIVIYIIAIIFIAGLITDQSPWVLLSGIGAMTAVLLLIFKDTILSFVAGIQITSYNLLRVGDWISMPEYGADGDVIEIALHTVKVQNWDKTYTIIPTYKLTEKSFKNWSGMQQTGGRRIKRSVYIDQNSIKLCDDQLIQKFSKIRLLKDYITQKKNELEVHNSRYNLSDDVLINTRRLTNLGTFRIYAQKYLEDHPSIRNDLTLMTRQLDPGPQGIPIEIYAFTNTTVWQEYESIQADIFDHLLSVIQEFELHIFQNPTGQDFRAGLKG